MVSDDSFGWSVTSDETMSSSENDNASQASSVLDRKKLKKELRENIVKTEGGSDDVLPNGGHRSWAGDDGVSAPRKKSKKNKIKTETDDTILQFDARIEEHSRMKIEPEEISHKEKKKKKKVKSEPEENETSNRKSKKRNKNKSQTQTEEDGDGEDTVAQEDESRIAQKISKKRKRPEENAGEQDWSALELIVKQEDRQDSSAQKKNKKRKARDEPEQLAGNYHDYHDGSFTLPPAPKKRKKHNASVNISDNEIKNGFDASNVKSEQLITTDSLDDSIEIADSRTRKKKKKSNISDVNNPELPYKTERELIRKDSIHFDDGIEDTDDHPRRKSSSSTIILSPKQKGVSSSRLSSERRRASSSSSTASQPTISQASGGTISRTGTESRTESNNVENKISVGYKSKNRASLSERIQFEDIHSEVSKYPQHTVARDNSSSSDSGSELGRKNNSVPVTSPLNITGKRISLSEKIRFEDDIDDTLNSENDYTSLAKNTSASTQLHKFMDKNPQLKALEWDTTVGAIDSDDEIWVLQCPRECEVAKLQGTEIVVDGKTKIKIDGQAYDGAPEGDTHRVAIVTKAVKRSQFVIKTMEPKGTVRFRKRLPKVQAVEVAAVAPGWRDAFIPLPVTKRRHPLFGHNYVQYTAARAQAAVRMRHTRGPTPTTPAREPTPARGESARDDIIKKKKKKRKRKLSEPENPEIVEKKLKRDPGGPEVWDSEKAIEKSLFDF